MTEHFVTVVLRVPEAVAEDMQVWVDHVGPPSYADSGYVIRPHYVHLIGTLPTLLDDDDDDLAADTHEEDLILD